MQELDCVHLARWQRRKNFPDWCERAKMSPAEQIELEQMIFRLDRQVQNYLDVEFVDGKVQLLCHEAVLLTFIKC
jgi:hypothetical protein